MTDYKTGASVFWSERPSQMAAMIRFMASDDKSIAVGNPTRPCAMRVVLGSGSRAASAKCLCVWRP